MKITLHEDYNVFVAWWVHEDYNVCGMVGVDIGKIWDTLHEDYNVCGMVGVDIGRNWGHCGCRP